MLLVLMVSFSFVLWSKEWVVTPFVLGGFILLSILELIRFLFRFQKKLSNTLHQYKYENEVPIRSDFPEVFEALKEIMEIRWNQDAVLEDNLVLFQSLVALQAQAVLICNRNGEVVFQSDAVSELLSYKVVSNFSELEGYSLKVYSTLKSMESNDQVVLEAKEFEFIFPKDIKVEMTKLLIRRQEFKVFHFSLEQANAQEFEAWANFAKVVAHEIRNGISPVKSLSNSLQDDLDVIGDENIRSDFKSALTIIENRCDNLLEFTEKYRKLVRITAPQKAYFSLNVLLEKLERLNLKSLENIDLHKIGFEYEIMLFGDEKQLMHVFENLLLNSLQAFERNEIVQPELSIEIKDQKSDVLVFMRDNGGGISEEDLPHIFLPFYTTQEEGSGIGLSVAQQILAKHKGQIHWVKEEQPFTTFCVRIPKGRG